MKTYLDFLREAISIVEKKKAVKIPVEKGKLGVHIDQPGAYQKLKKKVNTSNWKKISARLNTLVIFNKNKHPEKAAKYRRIRERLAKHVEKMQTKKKKS